MAKGNPFLVDEKYEVEPGLPSGFCRPVLAVPAANPLRCFALSLYGPHASGADLDANERAMLKRIAHAAAAVYAALENQDLRQQLAGFKRKLSAKGRESKKRRKQI